MPSLAIKNKSMPHIYAMITYIHVIHVHKTRWIPLSILCAWPCPQSPDLSKRKRGGASMAITCVT